MFTRNNALDQALDIAGSLIQNSNANLSNEPFGLGSEVSGQNGSSASITTVSLGIATITGLSGMTAGSVGRFLTISGAAAGSNNGTFLITTFNSTSSVSVLNSSAVSSDGNNGSINWIERDPYTLQDDINYVRTDRAAIKGTNYYSNIPTYQRPTSVGTNVPANLTNIAGKTTDAKALVTNRKFSAVSVSSTNTFITLNSTGALKHADAVDLTGVPIQDGADVNNYEASYVEIIDPTTESALEVLAGPNKGKRIFGRTRAGSATSPDSVEVEFRCVSKGSDLSTSVSYTWEASQPNIVDMYYGFRERLDNLNELALRRVLVNGIVGDADLSQDVVDIRSAIGISDNTTNLSSVLTNVSNYYPFINLGTATPTVVNAVNTLNEQIGNRVYSGVLLTSGQSISESLQDLSDAISGSSIVRVIERLGSDISANTNHTLPGGLTYTPDNTNNGVNMFVYTRGILRDPGSVSNGDDYQEVSTTQIKFFATQKAGDHINYFILQ